MRLLGVSLSPLSKGEDQLPLFQQPDNGKKEALAKAIDQVNDKFGEHTVTYGSTLTQEKGQRVISPAWRPSSYPQPGALPRTVKNSSDMCAVGYGLF